MKSISRLLSLFLIAFTLAHSLSAGAEGTTGKSEKTSAASIYVDAEQYVGHPDQSADLEGHVTVIRGAEQLTCDRAHVNMLTNDVEASGNVFLLTPKNFIKAEKINYNFNTQKGIVYDGFIQTGQETIEGKVIFKVGESDYSASDATYTSCVNCPPAWKISGSKIDATVGSYAYIKNPIIRVENVPVFWLPYMVIPIKTERQSGLLTPTTSISADNGFTLSDSYFWAIDKSHDATETLTNYAKRGLKEGLEYRYFADQKSRGNFTGNFLPDRFYGTDTRYMVPDQRVGYYNGVARNQGPYGPLSDYQVNRYAVHYDHHFVLPDDFTQNMDINFVRDTNYLSDFPRDIPGVNESALENRANLTKTTENTSTSIDVDLYENLLKVDPIGQDDQTVQRVPEFNFYLMPQKIKGTNLLLGLDTSYLGISRASKGFDPLDANGNPMIRSTFQTGDRYRTGQRLLFHPDLTYPINIGDVLDLIPEVEYTEARYSFGYSEKPTASRRYLRTSLQAKTRMSAVFGEEDPENIKHKYKNEIEPDVRYTLVPYLSQEEHQFFGTSGNAFLPHYAANQPITEFDDFQFDYRDRLIDKNLVTFGITDKLIQKNVDKLSGSYQEVVRYRISQSFDIANSNESNFRGIKDFVNGGFLKNPDGTYVVVPNPNQPWSEIRSLLDVKLKYFNFNSDISYYPYQGAATDSSTITFKDKLGNGISGSYSQYFAIQVPSAANASNQTTNLITQRSDAASLSIFAVTKFVDVSATASYDILAQALTSEVAYLLVKPPGKCYGLAISYEKYLQRPDPIWTFSIPIFFGEGKSFQLNHPPGV